MKTTQEQSQSILKQPKRLRILVGLIGLTLLLAGAAWWPPMPSQAPEAAAVPTTVPSIDYFPAQFVNQATEVEEHIQAF